MICIANIIAHPVMFTEISRSIYRGINMGPAVQICCLIDERAKIKKILSRNWIATLSGIPNLARIKCTLPAPSSKNKTTNPPSYPLSSRLTTKDSKN